jgi:uncharacterized protein YjdB
MFTLKRKLIFIKAVMLIIMFFLAGCSHDESEDNIPVSGVSLNKTSTTILLGQSEQLTTTVTPSDADNQNVSWSSGNINIKYQHCSC